MGAPQISAAYEQVLAYVNHQRENWSCIQEAEYDVSLVKSNYILGGKIDLIRAENGTVEIIDFKSEKKPDVKHVSEYLDRYKKQLQVYAHLVEERTGQKVSKITLYYTGESNGQPVVSFPYNHYDVSETVKEFDDIVQCIQRKEFSTRSNNAETCSNCDFRFYCKR